MRLTVTVGLLGSLALACGFFAFVHRDRAGRGPPTGQADAIVVLTGGSQRIGDAIDLLANGTAGAC